MRACVFGAGAVGGQLAVRLWQAGVETSVIARGAQLEAIRSSGVTLRVRDTETTATVAASDDPHAFGRQDVVIVTVKAPALPAVATAIEPLLDPETAVVFAMNGIPWWYFHRHGGPLDGYRLATLDPEDALLHAIGTERTVGAVIYAACETIKPGVVALRGRNNRMILGEIDGRISERTKALASALCRAGLTTTVTTSIRDEIWTKLMNNIASGLLALLTRCAVNEIVAEPACEAIMRSILEEVASIAEALGRSPNRDFDDKIASMRKLSHKPSILQDFEKRRTMEMEAMYGVTLALARMADVKTPNLDVMVTLVELLARSAALTGLSNRGLDVRHL